jgi:hypothetical protein
LTLEKLPLVEARKTHVRYLIISILFAVSCFSYGDRVALSIAVPAKIGRAHV